MSLVYDWANQPVSMVGSGLSNTYRYDGNLKRVRTIQNGKTTYWVYSALTGTPLYQDEVTDNVQTHYLSGGGASVRIRNGIAQYTHSDHQGSPVAASAANASTLWREHYTPFGEKTVDPAGNRNDVGYTGHVQDDASGLTYMQARFYDPVIGRFLSTDPIGYQDQINQYAYVANDPVNMVDPTGEAAQASAAASCGPAAVVCGAVILVVSCGVSEVCRGAVGDGVETAGDAIGDVAAMITGGLDGIISPSDNQSEGLTEGLPTGDDLDFDKAGEQLEERGWSEDGIKDLVDSTDPIGTSTDNREGRNDPATVYGNKDSGHVVVNDKTGEIAQVSDKNDADWNPDDRIEWND